MISYYFRNRLLISVLVTIIAVVVAISFASDIAASIDRTANIVTSDNQVEEFIAVVNIPQGSSAAEIASILSSEGLITSSLAFELYLRNENLSDKLRAGEYEISNKLKKDNIDTSNIIISNKHKTGVAGIHVDRNTGKNAITVVRLSLIHI